MKKEYIAWLWSLRPQRDYALFAKASRLGWRKFRVRWGTDGPYIYEGNNYYHILLGGGRMSEESVNEFTRYVPLTPRLAAWSDAVAALDKSIGAEKKTFVSQSIPKIPTPTYEELVRIRRQLEQAYGPAAIVQELQQTAAEEFSQRKQKNKP